MTTSLIAPQTAATESASITEIHKDLPMPEPVPPQVPIVEAHKDLPVPAPEMPPVEKAKAAIADILTSSEDIAKKALKALQLYLNNLCKEPKNPKFKKVLKTMPMFKNDIEKVKGAIDLMLAVGFKVKATMIEIEEVDIGLIKSVLDLIHI